MLTITYEEWLNICKMYLNQSIGRQQSYLQWYPFSLLSQSDKDLISSEEYFSKYIQSGLFAMNNKNWLVTDNYLQKADGSFRNSVLISPILYLALQCIGNHISKLYKTNRNSNISVFYSGNYEENRCHYKRDYDLFYKQIIAVQGEYKYFIKTDLSDFYNNININKLFHMIDININKEGLILKQKDLLIFKEIISYCGMNRFPLAENSLASSFLATIIYLDNVDQKLYSFLERCKGISNFLMIRYVDDLYILFNSEMDIQALNFTFNNILWTYSSILKEYNLTLNMGKSAFKSTLKISEELKKSLYLEYIFGGVYEFGEMFSEINIVQFFDNIKELVLNGELTVNTYNDAIGEFFAVEKIDLTANEVLNYFLYEKKEIFNSEAVISKIKELLDIYIDFISIDPKRIVLMIINTGSTELIKMSLNILFTRYRNDEWTSFDTTIAIHYLLNSKFKHIDLLKILHDTLPPLYDYYSLFCANSFLISFKDSFSDIFYDNVYFKGDKKLFYLLLMYRIEKIRGNILTAFAYYKNFFDRATSHIAYANGNDAESKKPNYKRYYEKGSLISFYSDIEGSKIIIEDAHDYRNSNPISHASAELLESDDTTSNLNDSIKKMAILIRKKVLLLFQ